LGKSNQSAKTNQAEKTDAQRGAPPPTIVTPTVGIWPEPAPKWGLWVTAALWLSWGAFLVWMMILRMAHG
jgi:hypothetical protein